MSTTAPETVEATAALLQSRGYAPHAHQLLRQPEYLENKICCEAYQRLEEQLDTTADALWLAPALESVLVLQLQRGLRTRAEMHPMLVNYMDCVADEALTIMECATEIYPADQTRAAWAQYSGMLSAERNEAVSRSGLLSHARNELKWASRFEPASWNILEAAMEKGIITEDAVQQAIYDGYDCNDAYEEALGEVVKYLPFFLR